MRFMQSKQDRLLMTIIFFLVAKRWNFKDLQNIKEQNYGILLVMRSKKPTSVKLFKKNYKAFLLNKYNA